MKPLEGKVAVVAGATRGAGRGIACMLGEAGATVYCTGRSVRGHPATTGRPETIEETAEMVTDYGGVGLAVQVDHSVEDQVQAFFARVRKEQGRLDILVNDIWGGDELSEWGKPFWELSMAKGLLMLQRAVQTHIITSRYGVPLMVERNAGLIVEITDGDYWGYRGNLFYDLAKISVIRLAYAMSADLLNYPITALAVTPDFCVPRRCSIISGLARPTGRMRCARTGTSPSPRHRITSAVRWRRWPLTRISEPRPAGSSAPGRWQRSTAFGTSTAGSRIGVRISTERWPAFSIVANRPTPTSACCCNSGDIRFTSTPPGPRKQSELLHYWAPVAMRPATEVGDPIQCKACPVPGIGRGVMSGRGR